MTAQASQTLILAVYKGEGTDRLPSGRSMRWTFASRSLGRRTALAPFSAVELEPSRERMDASSILLMMCDKIHANVDPKKELC